MDIAIKKINGLNLKYTGKGIGVAIIDTGIDLKYDFLRPRNRIVAFKDFVNKKLCPYDDNGHGTHISGIIAGNGYLCFNKLRGIAPETDLISIKTMDKNGEGDFSNFLYAVDWIYKNAERYNIKVLNLSIGSQELILKNILLEIVEELWDFGIVVVVAAGNDGPENKTVMTPADSKKVITVGAIDEGFAINVAGRYLEDFSSRTYDNENIKPDILAPGINILSNKTKELNEKSRFEEEYFLYSGTSMSAPMVSAGIALLLEKENSLSPNELKKRLMKTAFYGSKNDFNKKHGILDLKALLG